MSSNVKPNALGLFFKIRKYPCLAGWGAALSKSGSNKGFSSDPPRNRASKTSKSWLSLTKTLPSSTSSDS